MKKNKYCPVMMPLTHSLGTCTVCDSLNRQREDMEKEIKSLEQAIEDELYGWDFYPRSDRQANAVVKLIIQSLSASQAEGSREEEKLKVNKEV